MVDIEALNEDHHRRMAADRTVVSDDQRRLIAEQNANSRNNLLRAMLGAWRRFADPATPVTNGALLELGAGYAGDRAHLMEVFGLRRYAGVEVVRHVAEASKHLGVAHMAIDDIEEKAVFRWVYSRHVMEHVPDAISALTRVCQAMTRNGVVGAVTPHYFPDPEPAHISQLTVQQWCAAYRAAGLIPVYAEARRFACDEAHVVAVKPSMLTEAFGRATDAKERRQITSLLDP